MLKVGINNNVAITKVSKNDQNTLVIRVEELDVDVAEMLSQSEGSAESGKNELVFPPKTTGYDGAVKSFADIMKELVEYRNFLSIILKNYTSAENIEFDPFKGLSKDNTKTDLLNEAFLAQVVDNYNNQFIAMFEEYGDPERGFRFLMPRNAKGYLTFRPKFNNQLFMESMSVPEADTKLAFSAYQKTNGFDKPLDASADGDNSLPF